MRFYHWWPSRQFRKGTPIPEFALEEAKRRGSVYLTVAVNEVGERRVFGVAYCSPKDNPSRAMGRRIAEGRLQTKLKG